MGKLIATNVTNPVILLSEVNTKFNGLIPRQCGYVAYYDSLEGFFILTKDGDEFAFEEFHNIMEEKTGKVQRDCAIYSTSDEAIRAKMNAEYDLYYFDNLPDLIFAMMVANGYFSSDEPWHKAGPDTIVL